MFARGRKLAQHAQGAGLIPSMPNPPKKGQYMSNVWQIWQLLTGLQIPGPVLSEGK